MRRLEGDEVLAYDMVDPELAARVRIIRVPFLAPGSSGMTIGRFIFLRSDDNRDGTRELLAHELVHVRQYGEAGLLGFLSRYLRDYIRGLRAHHAHRAAYLSIAAEAEARAEVAEWKQRLQ